MDKRGEVEREGMTLENRSVEPGSLQGRSPSRSATWCMTGLTHGPTPYRPTLHHHHHHHHHHHQVCCQRALQRETSYGASLAAAGSGQLAMRYRTHLTRPQHQALLPRGRVRTAKRHKGPNPNPSSGGRVIWQPEGCWFDPAEPRVDSPQSVPFFPHCACAKWQTERLKAPWQRVAWTENMEVGRAVATAYVPL